MNLENFSFSEKDVKDAGKFMLLLAVSFVALNFFFSLFPLEWFELFFAIPILEALKLIGFSGNIVSGEPVLIVLDALNAPIGISYLCTGILELTVIWAALLASSGIEWKKRGIGIALSAITLIIFNFMRILASILAVFFLGFEAANFSHEILFRVFLFLTIAGFYYFWFSWATGKQSEKHGPKAAKYLKK